MLCSARWSQQVNNKTTTIWNFPGLSFVPLPVHHGNDRDCARCGRSLTYGSTCAVCAIALGLVEGLADVHNKSAGDALAFICDILPDKIRPGCKELVDLIGPSTDLFCLHVVTFPA